MLERIATVQGIGLLHQANGKPYACQRATLIYAENGRGKSTLAAILRSVSTGDTALISACKTLDGTLPPSAVLQFGSGHKVAFESGAWSEQRPELLVFDADFIGRNVHSGGAVNTDHRKNLLEFALGEAAVAARAIVEQATNESKAATDKVQGIARELAGYHDGMSLAQFGQLPQVADADTKIADLQGRLVAAGNVAAIQARAVPQTIAEPIFDIDGLFGGLGLSVPDIHAEAEKLVNEHIAKLGGQAVESWLNQGRNLGNGDTCPFCDQDIANNDLVHSYQTYFNVAYADLKAKVSALYTKVTAATAPIAIDSFAKSVAVAVAQASNWESNVPMQPITFDADKAYAALAAFREHIVELAARKSASPIEPIGTADEKAKAVVLWDQILTLIHIPNVSIKAAASLITEYKAKLGVDSVPQLQQQILNLQATKRRFDPKVVELLGQLAAARTVVESTDKAKKTARESLDSLMTKTLGKYQTSINALLKLFGASFSIKSMSANFRGNSPRSEYGLLLRGKDVVLEGGPPSFSTALSDGDKRTLAFVFFVASTLDDPSLATRTVVIDDPMCSLDMNRRHQTRVLLKKLHAKSAQLIVLAHDPYFLRDLRDAIRKDDKVAPIATFQLIASPNNYSDFTVLELDKECESGYAQHHRQLNDFAAGKGGDPKVVAKAIRPMLEGYLHRRFPGLVPKDLMFGQVVVLIRDSTAPSPLRYAANLVDDLNAINDYAGQFHHDTNLSADAAVVNAAELKTFVDWALGVVHKGAPP